MALTDERIQALALEVKQLEADIDKLEKKWKKRRSLIVKEMERRKATGLEYEGEQLIRIAYVAGERVTFSVFEAEQVLPAEQFQAVTKLEIDKDRLEAAVLGGTISPETVAQFSDVKKTAAYPRITVK